MTIISRNTNSINDFSFLALTRNSGQAVQMSPAGRQSRFASRKPRIYLSFDIEISAFQSSRRFPNVGDRTFKRLSALSDLHHLNVRSGQCHFYFALIYGISSPPGPTASGSTSGCAAWYAVKSGDQCNRVLINSSLLPACPSVSAYLPSFRRRYSSRRFPRH